MQINDVARTLHALRAEIALVGAYEHDRTARRGVGAVRKS